MKVRKLVALLMVCIQVLGYIPATAGGEEEWVRPQSTPVTTELRTSLEPTTEASVEPSSESSIEPSIDPSIEPSIDPSIDPSIEPSVDPSVEPTSELPSDPTSSPDPTTSPELSIEPSTSPTLSPEPTATEIPLPTETEDLEATSAPEVKRYDQDTRFTVTIHREPAADAPSEALVVLQHKEGEKWVEIADPENPSKDLTLSISVTSNGHGNAEFDISGFLADDAYRARLVSYGGASVGSDDFSVAYQDGDAGELTTDITIHITPITMPTAEPETTEPVETEQTVEPTVEPSPSPTETEPTPEPSPSPEATEPTDEPTAEPNALPEVYGEDAFYTFSLYMDRTATVAIALLDADAQVLETRSVTLDDQLEATALFALQGLPIQQAYTVRVVELDGMSSADAEAQGFTIYYEDGTLSTAAYIVGPQQDSGIMLMDVNPAPKAVNRTWQLNIANNLNNTTQRHTVSFELADDETGDGIECTPSGEGLQITPERATLTEGEAATFTITPNDVTGLHYTVSLQHDGQCTVTLVTSAEHYRIAGQSTADVDLDSNGAHTASFTTFSQIALEGSLNWNDNNATERPTVEVVLEASSDNGQSWAKISDAELVKKSYNEYGNTFTVDEYDANGNLLSYRLNQTTALANYLTEYVDGEPMQLRNTLKAEMQVVKRWNDIAYTEMRPTTDVWLATVELYRNDETIDITDHSLVQNGNEWTLTVNDLPAYSSLGLPYTYYVKDAVPTTSGEKGDSYHSTYENVEEYADRTDAAHAGGLLISTITAEDEFIFSKDWIDGDTTAEERPNVEFRLFRFAEGSGYDFESASPVQGMDVMTLSTAAEKEDNDHIVYTVSGNTSLPRYDEMGYRYVYFLTEKIAANTRDYVTVVNNYELPYANHSEVLAGPYVLNGGHVDNQSKATITPTATKIWKAKAVQGMQATVSMALYRTSEKNATAEPQPVLDESEQPVTLEMTGFTAERMTQTMAFPSQDQYDAEGYKYTYSVREIATKVNDDVAVPQGTTYFTEGSVFTTGEYSFRVHYDGDTVVNTLIGTTKLRVRKIWNVALGDGETGTIGIRLYQNNSLYSGYIADDITITPTNATLGTVTEATNTLNLSGTNVAEFEALFANLPRYDEEGAEYTYTVAEDPTSIVVGDRTYTFDGLSYAMEPLSSTNTEPVKTATITNISEGTGPVITFEIQKEWLDDSDLLHRVPIAVELCYRENEDDAWQVIDSTIQLTADGSWYTRRSYPMNDVPLNSPRWDCSNYTVREVSYGDQSEGSVWMTVGSYDETTAQPTANVKTKEHLYVATIQQNGASFTITNRRVGVLNIYVEKKWAVGALSGLTSKFELQKNGVATGKEETLAQNAESSIVEFANIDKYDERGVLIPYTVVETSLKTDADGASDVLFDDGALTLEVNGKTNRIVSHREISHYEIGDHHTDDTLTYTFTNQCSERAALFVNKVWRDLGELETRAARPDIVLRLTRIAQGREGAQEEAVRADRLWDTAINHWYWRCNFGVMERYDPDGYEYEYRVTESIVQSDSKYTIAYYHGETQPLTAGDSSEAIFSEDGSEDARYAVAGFVSTETSAQGQADTIINTLQGTMIFKVTKLWRNIPAWFDRTNLPIVYAALYRSVGDEEPTLVGRVEITNDADSYTVLDGAGNQELPLYNKYGVPYIYALKEEGASAGHPLIIDGYQEGDIVNATITNTYMVEASENFTPVEITVSKDWDWSQRELYQTHYPETIFTLSRTWTPPQNSAAQAHTEEVATHTFPAGEVWTEEPDSLPSFTFVEDQNGDPLPYFAPDGSVYTYHVSETTVNGYDEHVDVQVTLSKQSGETAYKGSVVITNSYQAEALTELTAYKIWNDSSDKYELRPDIADMNGASPPVTFQLHRSLHGTDEEDITDTVTATWKVDEDNTNLWVCTFKPKSGEKLLKYDTNGELYRYTVTETLAEPYNTIYPTQIRSWDGRTYTNTLATVTVAVTKQWMRTEGGTSEALDSDTLTILHELGVINSLTFNVQRRVQDGSWTAVPDPNSEATPAAALTRTFGWEALQRTISDTSNSGRLIIATGLPKYDGEGKEYQYWVEEVAPQAEFSVGNEQPAWDDRNTTTTITNTFSVRKLFFVKNWIDNNNREGKRPASLDVVVMRNSDEDQTSTVKLSALTSSTDSKKWVDGHDPKGTEGNRWVGELIVPESGSYTATEVAPSGYAQDGNAATDFDNYAGKPYAWWSFTNRYDTVDIIKMISISATKVWADSDVLYYMRPETVAFKLQRKLATDAEWKDIEAGDADYPSTAGEHVQTLTVAADGTTQTAQWTNLPVYRSKTESQIITAVYEYRVVEVSPTDATKELPGYNVQYAPSQSVNALSVYEDTATPQQATITVTNTPTKTSLNVQKTWEDNNNAKGYRPSEITVYLQRRVKDGTSDWANVVEPSTSTPVTKLLNASNQWRATFSNLATHNANAEEYEYRAVEVSPPDRYIKTSETTTASGGTFTTKITNQLQIVDVYADKTWAYTIDGAQAAALTPKQLEIISTLGGFPTITFQVQRRVKTVGNTNTWVDMTESAAQKTIQSEQVLQTLFNNGVPIAYEVAEGLPKFVPATATEYDASTQQEYEYRVVEIIGGTQKEPSDTDIAVTNEDDHTTNTTTSLVNALSLRTLYFAKNWQDDIDREDVRPDELTITVTRNETQTVTLTLTPTTTSGDPQKSIATHKELEDKTRWLGELIVPLEGSYTAAETVPAGYTQGVTSSDTTPYNSQPYAWWSFTNTHALHNNPTTITLTATKQWANTASAQAYGDRPSRVEFKLQRKLATEADTETNWKDIPASDPDYQNVTGAREQILQATTDAEWAQVKATWANLPRYQAKTVSDEDMVAYCYRVVEVPLPGYQATYGTASVDASTVDADSTTNIIVTNTAATTSLTVTKTWDEGEMTATEAAEFRPANGITIRLQRRLASSTSETDWANVDATLQLPDQGRWSGTFADLPTHSANGQAYEYRAIEPTPPINYIAEATTSKAGDGTYTTSITNSLRLVNVSVQKTWQDQDGAPISAELLKLFNDLCGLPDITFQVQRRENEQQQWQDVSGATDTIRGAEFYADLTAATPKNTYLIGTGLPRYIPASDTQFYIPGQNTPYQYRVVERMDGAVTGVTLVEDVDVAPCAQPTGDATVENVTTALSNTLLFRKLYFVKNWNDASDSDDVRPDEISITVTHTPISQNNPAGEQIITVKLTSSTTSTDPKATLGTEDEKAKRTSSLSRWFGELLVPDSGTYTAAEIAPTTDSYFQRTDLTEHDTDTGYDWWSFTNERQRKTLSISVEKVWVGDEKAIAFGDRVRPTSIWVKLQRKLATAQDSDWADLTANSLDLPAAGYQEQLELVPEANGTWLPVSWTGLPAYQAKATQSDGKAAYCYRVVEVTQTPYASTIVYGGDSAQSFVNGDTATGDVHAVLTNAMETVDLIVDITWEDYENAAHTRPSTLTVQLQHRLLGEGETDWRNVNTTDLDNAPVSNVITPQNDIWRDHVTFLGLPKYSADDRLFEYRVIQIGLPPYYGTSMTLEVSDDKKLTTEKIHNVYAQWLEIDNITRNPATGETDVGGYVAIESLTPSVRDIDPYQCHQMSVSWAAETNWQHAESFAVTYQEPGDTTWETITASPTDLTPLLARFPDAVFTNTNGTYRLTLATFCPDMPYRTRVLVSFVPTLAVENTTRTDQGGEVEVETWSSSADGTDSRYHAMTARGRADHGWMVDLSHLQLSIPNGVHGDYSSNLTAVPIRTDRNGNFTATISAVVAGVQQQVQVSGTVTVLARDSYRNPTEVSVTITPLEIPLDVGIPFKRAAVPGNIPATGDPFVWLLLALMVSGVSLGAASIVMLRRRRVAR